MQYQAGHNQCSHELEGVPSEYRISINYCCVSKDPSAPVELVRHCLRGFYHVVSIGISHLKKE